MVFSKHFVASIKVDSKILREQKQDGAPTVYIPFGSEYSILLKNLSTQRAVVRVTIDGTDVLSGKTLIVEPNSDLELTRFVDSLSKGNRFKFIEKTQEISDFRGDKIDDGIVRVEYQFEKPVLKLTPTKEVHHYYHHSYNWWGNNTLYSNSSLNDGSAGLNDNALYSSSRISGALQSKSLNNISVGCSVGPNSASALRSCGVTTATASQGVATTTTSVSLPTPSDDGITVKGSVSDQRFSTGTVGELEEEKHVITLQIRGKVADAVVTQPITVSTKIRCTTCGRSHASSANFCGQCGTALSVAI